MSECPHNLAERETDVADGYCPQCMSAEIAALKAKLKVAREALDRSKHLLADIMHNGLSEMSPAYPNNSNVQAMINELEFALAQTAGGGE